MFLILRVEDQQWQKKFLALLPGGCPHPIEKYAG
jgi:hypothetical protein